MGPSDWIAKGMEKLIHSRLTKRRKDMNLIDDFSSLLITLLQR